MKVLIFSISFLLLESISPIYSQGLVAHITQMQRNIAERENPPEKPCPKDGKTFPPGTTRDGKLCSNGEWIPIPPS